MKREKRKKQWRSCLLSLLAITALSFTLGFIINTLHNVAIYVAVLSSVCLLIALIIYFLKYSEHRSFYNPQLRENEEKPLEFKAP